MKPMFLKSVAAVALVFISQQAHAAPVQYRTLWKE